MKLKPIFSMQITHLNIPLAIPKNVLSENIIQRSAHTCLGTGLPDPHEL